MKRIFDDKDVKRWTERFDKMNLSIYMSPQGAFSASTFSYNHRVNSTYDVLKESRKLNYSFCVMQKQMDRFNSILESNYNREFVIPYEAASYLGNEESITCARPEFNKTKTRIYGVDYVLHQFLLHTDLYQIITHITHIEDTFISLKKHYDIDKDGEEVNSLPFQLHDVVSYNDTKDHTEYIITDISHNREDIEYTMMEISEKLGKSIVLSEIHYTQPEHIKKSRGTKLEELIN